MRTSLKASSRERGRLTIQNYLVYSLGAEQSAQYELPSIFLILSEAFRTYTFFVLAAELDRSACDLASD